jgi:hypothetical protein
MDVFDIARGTVNAASISTAYIVGEIKTGIDRIKEGRSFSIYDYIRGVRLSCSGTMNRYTKTVVWTSEAYRAGTILNPVSRALAVGRISGDHPMVHVVINKYNQIYIRFVSVSGEELGAVKGAPLDMEMADLKKLVNRAIPDLDVHIKEDGWINLVTQKISAHRSH